VGQEARPFTGIVYNIVDRASLTYECTSLPANPQEIRCKFIQTSVRHKTKPEDLARDLEAMSDEYRKKGNTFSAQECDGFEAAQRILEGKEAGPDPALAKKYLENLNPMEKADTLKLMASFVRFCRQPSEANALQIIRTGHEKKLRTCNVSAHEFSQTLRRSPSGTTWTVVSQPTGDCGVVQLDRFEEAHSIGKVKFWDYYARKAVTNPNGVMLLGNKCSGLDQREYKYQWQTETYHVGCDYIEFSPL
jgi:hypothetical protein